MKKYFVLLLLTIFAVGIKAQDAAPAADATSLELAKAAVKLYGGDKFKDMKTLVVKGTTDVSGAFPQSIPATFVMILSGEKYRIEINNPFQPFKQIYDGEETYSSISGFNLPPINRLGFPLLQRLGLPGFNVSDLPDAIKKKKKGFRITSPEGYFTDFIVDEKTGKIKSFESSYDVNGRAVTTSVEINRTRDIDGVTVPEIYAQRFDLGQTTIYSAFKAKEIIINSEVSNDVFVMN